MTRPGALAGAGERLWPLVLLSAAFHVAFVAVALLVRPPPLANQDQKPIVARLVRLGEKRPEQWLPRREEPKPEAAPRAPDAVPVPAPAAPAERAVALPSAKPAPQKPAPPRPASAVSGKGSDALSRALDKVKKDDRLASRERWGDPNGIPDGAAESGAEGDRYLALVTDALQRSYRLPETLSERERKSLHATVVLFIERNGKVSRHVVEQGSGNAAFDAALERAIRDARIPPPPPELVDRYRRIGLGVNFKI